MKSFVVIGLGRFGSAVATELYKRGNEVLAVDMDADVIQRIADSVTHAIVGDAKEESVLRAVGVRNFDCAIVAIASDIQDSVLVTLMLKEMGVKYVIAKGSNALHTKVLDRIGADRVVFPEHDMGQRLAQILTSSNVIDFIELSPDFSIVEIHAPLSWAGKTLIELSVRAEYGLNVLALRGQDGRMTAISPTADQIVHEGDVMVVVGANDDIERIGNLQ